MTKKKLIAWLAGILVNLAALIGIYLSVKPAPPATAAKPAGDSAVAADSIAPPPPLAPNAGLLSRVLRDVKTDIAFEERERAIRERKLSLTDTVSFRTKIPLHLAQQKYYEDLAEGLKIRKSFGRRGSPSLFASETSVIPAVHLHEHDWDSLNNISTAGRLGGYFRLKPGVQVYGWHPYWMGSAYRSYNFSLLSTVAYYGAEVEAATGEITNSHGWETTGLINAVGDNSCRVELAVINMGEDNNADLLSDSLAQANLIFNLFDLLRNRGDGICLDFEQVPTRMRANLVKFTGILRDTLTKAAKAMFDTITRPFAGYTLTLVLPAFDCNDAYDVKALAPFVDRFVMTGYDYYGSSSRTTGPGSPLRSGIEWNAPSIERSVDDYLLKGIPPEKLVVGLPYYGVAWQAADAEVPSSTVRFLGYPMWRDLRSSLALRSFGYDTTSVTAFYATEGTLPQQYWFENTETLSEKYRWAQQKHIGGVGIWALGYDNGFTDLWQALRDNFARDRLGADTTYHLKFVMPARDTTALPKDTEWGIVAANGHSLIFNNPYTLLYCGLAAFVIIILLQVVLDRDPWNELFNRRLVIYAFVSLAGVAALICIGLALWTQIAHKEIYLLLGGIIAGYLLFRLTQRIAGKKEILP
jgi:spore germination protein